MSVSDGTLYKKRRAINILQSAAILITMAGIVASVGLLIAGTKGLVISLAAGALILVLSPRVSPALVLRMYRARAISPGEAPELYEVIYQLSRRADLAKAPALYYIPSNIMNAFSVGSRDVSAIALTDGLLRALTWNEMTGVLAHEMSHIQRDDLKIMGLADIFSRFTIVMANIGMLLFFVYLPVFLFTSAEMPVVLILVLVIAPRLSIFLQLALSRTREFDADLNAVRLTGDPRGLASALKKIEVYSTSLWETLIMPGRKVPVPSTLRTHPHTGKRIELLMEMEDTQKFIVYPHHISGMLPRSYPPVGKKPGWKFFGLWH